MDIVSIARVCHEVNRAYCMALGDNSQVPWVVAPDWQRHSAIQGVSFIISHPDAGPGASHESWLKQKEADGWVFSPIKDPEAKTHPCMVPFYKLPHEQQAKDHIFVAIVRALTPHTIAELMAHPAAVPLPDRTAPKRNPMEKIVDPVPGNVGKPSTQALKDYQDRLDAAEKREVEEQAQTYADHLWPGREAEMRRLGLTEAEVENRKDHLLTDDELMKDTG